MSINKRYFGGYNVGDPPLPIPNREVKPNRADGTAYSGRVGSCQFWRRLLVVRLRVFSLFITVYIVFEEKPFRWYSYMERASYQNNKAIGKT